MATFRLRGLQSFLNTSRYGFGLKVAAVVVLIFGAMLLASLPHSGWLLFLALGLWAGLALFCLREMWAKGRLARADAPPQELEVVAR